MLQRPLILAVAVLLLAVSHASAQAGAGSRQSMPGRAGRQGMMGRQGMGMAGQTGRWMMATGRASPAVILRMGRSLDLTDEQTSRLQEIRDRYATTRNQGMRDAMAARRNAAAEIRKETPDFSVYEKALTEAGRNMVEARLAAAHAAVDARDVLTSKQRQKLETGLEMLREMMGGPGMRDGGGMRGGGSMLPGGPGAMPGGS